MLSSYKLIAPRGSRRARTGSRQRRSAIRKETPARRLQRAIFGALREKRAKIAADEAYVEDVIEGASALRAVARAR
jgi:hypothetical protein